MIVLPDEIADDPGLLRAGVYGKAAFLDLVAYAASQRTDGFVPGEFAAATKDRAKGVDALLASGVLERVVVGEECRVERRAKSREDVVRAAPFDGFWIPSYIRWNLTREEGENTSRERSAAGKKGAAARERRAVERAGDEANAEASAQASAQASPKQVLPRGEALAKHSSPVQSSEPPRAAIKEAAATRTPNLGSLPVGWEAAVKAAHANGATREQILAAFVLLTPEDVEGALAESDVWTPDTEPPSSAGIPWTPDVRAVLERAHAARGGSS